MQDNNAIPESAEDRYYGVGGFIFEIVKIFFLAIVIIVPIRVFLFQPFFVQGASMEPNFENKQYLIVNEFGYKETRVGLGENTLFTVKSFKELERQEVVVFRYPKDPKTFFIKRIIGLPGEKIEIKNNKIIIYNGESPEGFVLDEGDYLPEGTRTTGAAVVALKDDEYFVMGDNRLFSSDSRSWGPISKEDVIGKAFVRAWPLDKISIF